MKICEICGEPFLASHGRQKYCSAACREKAIEKSHTESYERRKEKITPVNCINCGKEFIPGRRGQKYCSYECGNEYRYKLTPKKEPKGYSLRVCFICGKEFKPKCSSQKYCSKECNVEARHQRYKKSVVVATQTPKVEEKPLTAASERWKRMSWKEISAELARLNISYGVAQQMYYNNTLPEDFGLGGVGCDR